MMENLSEVSPRQVMGTPQPRGSSLPAHAAHPVMQKASAPTARHDNTRTGGGTLRKNTISKAAAAAAARAQPLGAAPRAAQRREGLSERCCVSQPDQEINRNKLEQHRQQQRLHCTPGRARGLRSPQPSLRKSDSFLLQNLEGMKRSGACRLKAEGSSSSLAPRPEDAPQAHRAPAVCAHDSGGERLTAAHAKGLGHSRSEGQAG